MAVKPIPEGHAALTPYLIVRDAPAFVVFLERAFGGRERMRIADSEGAIRHGEVEIGGSRVMLADATDESSLLPAMLHLYVEDVDGAYRKALDAGAHSLREPTDQYYGDRIAGVKDAFGNQWWIASHVEDVSLEELERRQAAQR
jgi:PhnB protein